MTHDYKRHGTTTLFAALNVLDGTVIGRCMHATATRSSSASSTPSNARCRPARSSTPILDNYATHKHPKVRAWLARHPRWTFHFTPTSGSWLNAVESFFSALTRRRIRRGSVPLHRRPAGGHPSLPRRAQRRPQALRLDQARRARSSPK